MEQLDLFGSRWESGGQDNSHIQGLGFAASPAGLRKVSLINSGFGVRCEPGRPSQGFQVN